MEHKLQRMSAYLDSIRAVRGVLFIWKNENCHVHNLKNVHIYNSAISNACLYNGFISRVKKGYYKNRGLGRI